MNTVPVASGHQQSLAAKHAELENRLGAEERRPRPDEIVIAMLKKQKLRLKEAMASR